MREGRLNFLVRARVILEINITEPFCSRAEVIIMVITVLLYFKIQVKV